MIGLSIQRRRLTCVFHNLRAYRCLSLMARSFFLLYHFSGRRFSDSFRGFFFIPTSLALITSLFILFYISSTSNLFTHPHETHLLVLKSAVGSSTFSPPSHQFARVPAETPHLSSGFDVNTKGMWIPSFVLQMNLLCNFFVGIVVELCLLI